MPKAKDITGDIGKLRKRKALPTGEAPPPVRMPLERRQAFNGVSFFCWVLIVLFLVLQAGFLVWLA